MTDWSKERCVHGVTAAWCRHCREAEPPGEWHNPSVHIGGCADEPQVFVNMHIANQNMSLCYTVPEARKLAGKLRRAANLSAAKFKRAALRPNTEAKGPRSGPA